MGFELLCNKEAVSRNGRTSCPLSKALIMLFRGGKCKHFLWLAKMSERISAAFAVTERKENRTLREKGVRKIWIRFKLVQEVQTPM